MTSTVFKPGTVIPSAWLNDVNSVTYNSSSGTTGTTTRTQLSKNSDVLSVKDFGALGNNTADDTVAINAAASALAAAGGGLIYLPRGIYKTTAPILLPQAVGMYGEGGASVINCVATNGIRVSSNGDLGPLRLMNFAIHGSDATQFVGIEFMFGTTIPVSPRIEGMLVSSVAIDQFLTGVRMKNVWHSTFQGVTTNRCKNGFQILGQCINIVMDACKGYRGITGSSDGSIGVVIDSSSEYVDAAARRPEDVRITNGTLMFAFDTQVQCTSCLVFGITDCDLDFTVNYGVRVIVCNGGCFVERNWIAGDQTAGGVPKLIAFDALGTASSDLISVKNNNLSFSGVSPAAGSYGIQMLSNRTGQNLFQGNAVYGNVSPGATFGVILSGSPVTLENNYIGGVSISIVTTTFGHIYKQNTFNGPIQRATPGAGDYDVFDRNTGTAVTCYHGNVSIPSSNTSTTISLASLSLSSPVTGSPAHLQIKTLGYQAQGTADQGSIRAYYDGSGNIVVKTPTAVGSVTNIWIDLESY